MDSGYSHSMENTTQHQQENYIETVRSDVEQYLLDLPKNVQKPSMKKVESDYDLYLLHGQLSCARDLPEKALRSFNECLQLNPASFTACAALGNVHRGRGELTQALDYFEKAHAIEPRDFKTMLLMLYLKLELNAPISVTAPLEYELLSLARQTCKNAGIRYEDFTTATSLRHRHPDWAQAFTKEAHENFSRDKFTFLHQLFPEPLTKLLYLQYMEHLDSGYMLFQDHMQRYVKPDDPLSALVHHQLCEHVENFVGAPIVPTYNIGIHYTKGGHIKPHLDRRQNEISMSICIGAEPGPATSPLYAKRGDEEVCDILQPNDAFLYRGNEIVHYRKPVPEGHTVTQLIVGFRSINKNHCNCQ